MTVLIGEHDHLREADFARISSFILSATGIKLSGAKKTMVEGRLQRRARKLGFNDLGKYVEAVFSGWDQAEAINLINAITTNKTDFFREPQHFDFLRETALPEFRKNKEPTRLWSAACSIGAEPFTIAMVSADFARLNPDWEFSILASDISTDALGKAVKAIFPEEMADPIPLEMRKRYLLRSNDSNKHLVRMSPEIRNLVEFARINLVEANYPLDFPMDIIFCRNIFIYFDRETQETVIKRLCRHLRKGGYLILGHTDSTIGMNLPLENLGNSIFRRK